MANAKFNLEFYKEALMELWANKCPDVIIAKVIGLNNSTVSKFRRSFNIERSNNGSKIKRTWTYADALEVFKKHGCADFSANSTYVLEPSAVSVQNDSSIASAKKTVRQLSYSDFTNPKTASQAIEDFIYYNLFAPKIRLVSVLDELFIRAHKKPLGTAAIKEFYSKALTRYEKEYGFAYRFAEPMFSGEKTVSEIFLIYCIIHFAQKAKNKNANPEFINKYCVHIWETGPVKVSYLDELYDMLGITIHREDFVPSESDFKAMKTALYNKEEVNFVPFPLLYSSSDRFALPSWAAKKYQSWLSKKIDKCVHISSTVDVCPSVEALPEIVNTDEDTVSKEVIDSVVNTEEYVNMPLDIMPEDASTFTFEESSSGYPMALLDIINITIKSGNYLTASKLLKLMHAETQGIDYDIVLKGE